MKTTTPPIMRQPISMSVTAPSHSLISQAIAQKPNETQRLNDEFIHAERPHALLITNHGYAGPKFPAGGPDSGGQITYVNELATWLLTEGFKVTVATRAFRPDEEYATFGQRMGVAFFAGQPLARYIYVPGLVDTFLPKEHIFADLPAIAANLAHVLREEAALIGKRPWEYVSWINSHYWDGGVVGQMLVRHWHRASDLPLAKLNRHSWNAHSIGTLKEDNMRREFNPLVHDAKYFRAKLAAMNFPMRDHVERGLVGGAQGIYNGPLALFPNLPPAGILVWTSEEIRDHMLALDKPADTPLVHFPPGTDIERYYPRTSVNDDGVQKFFSFLAERDDKAKTSGKRGIPSGLIARMKANPQEFNVIVEASRMDETKRKHIVIEAMQYVPDNTILFITGKRDNDGIYDALSEKIDELQLHDRVFLLGFVPDEIMGPLQSLPQGNREDQFRLAFSVGASRMEGWGMSVMDGTAGGMALIASAMTPYATFLKNRDDAAVVIPVGSDEPRAYADALLRFISNPAEALAMAARSLSIARSLYWPKLIKQFLEAQGL